MFSTVFSCDPMLRVEVTSSIGDMKANCYGNQLVDDGSSSCVLSLVCIRSSSPLEVDVGSVPGRR